MEWPGLLVGDVSQPRGGPMLSGHASHQIGLDADIWLNPMPPRTLTPEERENLQPRRLSRSADARTIRWNRLRSGARLLVFRQALGTKPQSARAEAASTQYHDVGPASRVSGYSLD
jgi:penicillin-insensitive murein DD-endopeptidase